MSLNHVSHSFPSRDVYQTYPSALHEVQHVLLQTMEQFGEWKTRFLSVETGLEALLQVHTCVLPPLMRTLEPQAIFGPTGRILGIFGSRNQSAIKPLNCLCHSSSCFPLLIHSSWAKLLANVDLPLKP